MNERHVVVGAGPVGLATAELLVEQGKEVLLVSRSGAGPEIARACAGRRPTSPTRAGSSSWPRVRPRSTTASTRRRTRCGRVLAAGRRRRSWRPPSGRGAVLVTAAALYPYGPVDGPMVEGLPDAATTKKALIRAGMWAEAKQPPRRRAGSAPSRSAARTTWARGSRPRPATSPASRPPRSRGGPCGSSAAPTSRTRSPTSATWPGRWSGSPASRPPGAGSGTRRPTPPRPRPRCSQDVAASVGRSIGKVKSMPHVLLSVGGAVVPLLRELRETEYQFAAPYVLDSSAIEGAFGLAPTPWDEVCRATAENALRRPESGRPRPVRLGPCGSD